MASNLLDFDVNPETLFHDWECYHKSLKSYLKPQKNTLSSLAYILRKRFCIIVKPSVLYNSLWYISVWIYHFLCKTHQYFFLCDLTFVKLKFPQNYWRIRNKKISYSPIIRITKARSRHNAKGVVRRASLTKSNLTWNVEIKQSEINEALMKLIYC